MLSIKNIIQLLHWLNLENMSLQDQESLITVISRTFSGNKTISLLDGNETITTLIKAIKIELLKKKIISKSQSIDLIYKTEKVNDHTRQLKEFTLNKMNELEFIIKIGCKNYYLQQLFNNPAKIFKNYDIKTNSLAIIKSDDKDKLDYIITDGSFTLDVKLRFKNTCDRLELEKDLYYKSQSLDEIKIIHSTKLQGDYSKIENLAITVYDRHTVNQIKELQYTDLIKFESVLIDYKTNIDRIFRDIYIYTAISINGTYIASSGGYYQDKVYIWKLGDIPQKIKHEFKKIAKLLFNNDETELAIISNNYEIDDEVQDEEDEEYYEECLYIYVYNVTTLKLKYKCKHYNIISCAIYNLNNQLLTTDGYAIYIWYLDDIGNIQKKELISEYELMKKRFDMNLHYKLILNFKSFTVSSDNRYLAFFDDSEYIRLIDLESNELVKTITGGERYRIYLLKKTELANDSNTTLILTESDD